MGQIGRGDRGENSQYIFSVILAAMGAKFVNLATHAVNFFVDLATEVKPLLF